MTLPAHLYLAIRDVDTDRGGAPLLPESWWGTRWQRVGPWWVWRIPGDGRLVAAARVNSISTRGLYALAGPQDWLDSLDSSEVAPAREVWRLAIDGVTQARQVARAWRWYRVDCTERATQEDVDAGLATSVGDPVQRDDVRRRLLSEGHMLPDPATEALPWDLDADGQITTTELAVIRVRTIHRPALVPGVPTIAGVSLHSILEQEPDRGEA